MIPEVFEPECIKKGRVCFNPATHKSHRRWTYLDENLNTLDNVLFLNYPVVVGSWFVSYDDMDNYIVYRFIAIDSSQSYTIGKMCEIKNGEVKYFTGQAFIYCDIMVKVFREHVLKKYRNAMRRFQFKHSPHEQ